MGLYWSPGSGLHYGLRLGAPRRRKPRRPRPPRKTLAQRNAEDTQALIAQYGVKGYRRRRRIILGLFLGLIVLAVLL